ncbi:M50 family metallopeptidase [Staphylococcus simiae]|uniref:M50 family metallopeptidase n=1 Tax=Staphylococcus simiae TaxID=308354 RepID=UPI001A96D744|nr:M50 family metallopeptidase [Staphylococcus simiae]MBO1198812.1 M50 family metallopeptidase [Staphylococcus simiae]MBO1201009.1 M50 family metallopeptidase [Staphylococcus simiae]MBO1203825.1 M50 family metallopeptidase [Staphylococcus simiae]MBO1212044.1 M50 family metallopeptidase [Staphylococcus simiae]MBO1229398.1 M50 family metallopeptidase [Staphylococcus simiae]
MTALSLFFNTHVQLNIIIIAFIAITYIVVHYYRNRLIISYLDILLNYIPVLTHEFGHVIFNKIAGGRAKDLVIVTSPNERQQTLQQGYAITQSKSIAGQWLTTLGGYIMPPLMLLLGLASSHYTVPSLFVLGYLLIFVYFLVLTSRKLSPIIVIILISTLLYFIVTGGHTDSIQLIASFVYQYILGVLLGEVLQSSWTIIKLTFFRPRVSWDGSALAELSHIPTFIYSTIWIVFNLYSVDILLTFTGVIQ